MKDKINREHVMNIYYEKEYFDNKNILVFNKIYNIFQKNKKKSIWNKMCVMPIVKENNLKKMRILK